MATYTETAARLSALFTNCHASDDDTRRCIADTADDADRSILLDMIRAAEHNGLHNDDSYSMVEEILDAISDQNCDDEDDAGEIDLPESDIYTYSLMQWAARNSGHCDQVNDEYGFGTFDSITAIVQAAQQIAYRETLDAVLTNWPSDDEDDDD